MTVLGSLSTLEIAAAATSPEITFEWKRWAAASLLSGVTLETVIDRLEAAGYDRTTAGQSCGELRASPAFAAGEWASQRLKKLESMLTVLQNLRDMDGGEVAVDQRAELSREEFLNNYYATNTPVLLDDVTVGWPALTKWSPQFFGEVLGDQVVEVMGNRNSNPNYEREANAHRSRMTMRSFVDLIRAGSTGNDAYLVANNHLLESAGAAPLWNDFAMDPRYLDQARPNGSVHLWFGPQGTITPLHHDILNVLFVQIFGQKRFTLISPLESHCLSNNVGVFSDVDIKAPDPVRHPRYLSTHRQTVVVGPGQALFIPVGWWHCVEALSSSASLSFTKFIYRNSFRWENPNIIF